MGTQERSTPARMVKWGECIHKEDQKRSTCRWRVRGSGSPVDVGAGRHLCARGERRAERISAVTTPARRRADAKVRDKRSLSAVPIFTQSRKNADVTFGLLLWQSLRQCNDCNDPLVPEPYKSSVPPAACYRVSRAVCNNRWE